MTDSLLERPPTSHELRAAMRKKSRRDLEERIDALDRFCDEHPRDRLRIRKARQIQATYRAELKAIREGQR